jgi:copper chaperone
MERFATSISGMTCGHCVRAVKQALEEIDGVQVEQVAIGSATMNYDPARTSPERMLQAIEDAGYQVRPTQLGRAAPGSGGTR